MTTSVQIVEISMLRYIPELVAWGIGLVLAVIMLRRGSGKAERLLLAGCSLMLFARAASILLGIMIPWLEQQRISAQGYGIIISLVAGIPSLAGLVCLVLAFWFRFRKRKPEAA